MFTIRIRWARRRYAPYGTQASGRELCLRYLRSLKYVCVGDSKEDWRWHGGHHVPLMRDDPRSITVARSQITVAQLAVNLQSPSISYLYLLRAVCRLSTHIKSIFISDCLRRSTHLKWPLATGVSQRIPLPSHMSLSPPSRSGRCTSRINGCSKTAHIKSLGGWVAPDGASHHSRSWCSMSSTAGCFSTLASGRYVIFFLFQACMLSAVGFISRTEKVIPQVYKNISMDSISNATKTSSIYWRLEM